MAAGCIVVSLAGAVGFNGAAADVPEERLRLRVANAAWNRWTPVNLVGVGAHLLGGASLLAQDRRKVVAQQGLSSVTTAKAVLTGAALAVTAYTLAVTAYSRVGRDHPSGLLTAGHERA